MVRIVPQYTAFANQQEDDVLALYPDRLIVFRKKRKALIPSDAGEVGGEAILKSIRSKGPKLDLEWSDVKKVEDKIENC